jgi:hypothetical protein
MPITAFMNAFIMNAFTMIPVKLFLGESSPHGESVDGLIADLEQMLADAKCSRDDIFDVSPDRQ